MFFYYITGFLSLKLKGIIFDAVSIKIVVGMKNFYFFNDSLLIKNLFTKNLFAFLILIVFLLSHYACNTTEPIININSDQDTTSHNFTFKTWTFGEHSSSVLYDVAIIDENNIWVVGEIYMNDSLGNHDPIAYNAINWDGSEWHLKRIYFPTVCGSASLTPYPAKAIFAFNDGQIWVSSSGDKMAILENRIQIDKFCLPENVSMSINKIWGCNSNDLYIVGNKGNIAHFTGPTTGWQKIESTTDINLRDVWGSPDGSVVWSVGFDDFYGTVFLRNTINGFEKVLEITDPEMPHPPNQITHIFKSLWTDKSDTIYLGAVGRIYAAPYNTNGDADEKIWWDYQNQQGYPPETNVIRGNSDHDIFVAGYLNFILLLS